MVTTYKVAKRRQRLQSSKTRNYAEMDWAWWPRERRVAVSVGKLSSKKLNSKSI